MQGYTIHIANNIFEVKAENWNRLLHTTNPFIRYEFLSALEKYGCVGDKTGWIPHHFIIKDENNAIIGALPAYLKTNSFGEFVFDWSWADAYERAGLHYYPKLVSAIPFTPVTGPRCLVGNNTESPTITKLLISAFCETANKYQLSSAHLLFPSNEELQYITQPGLLTRMQYQYHWSNRNYESFAHYISFFRSRNRKKINRERKKAVENGVIISALKGDEITIELWEVLYKFYRNTFQEKGNYPALTFEFFLELSNTMPNNIIAVLAKKNEKYIAGAINFCSDETLYGRYWGCDTYFDSLHFEVCFYQGIEYCINNNLQFFEPGAQGEHKITRGFLPTETWSLHWLTNSKFREVIQNFISREKSALKEHRVSLDAMSPFRAEESL